MACQGRCRRYEVSNIASAKRKWGLNRQYNVLWTISGQDVNISDDIMYISEVKRDIENQYQPGTPIGTTISIKLMSRNNKYNFNYFGSILYNKPIMNTNLEVQFRLKNNKNNTFETVFKGKVYNYKLSPVEHDLTIYLKDKICDSIDQTASYVSAGYKTIAEALADNHTATLTEALEQESINVNTTDDISGFEASGYIRIGPEVMAYDSKTTTTFNISERGALNTTVQDHNASEKIYSYDPGTYEDNNYQDNPIALIWYVLCNYAGYDTTQSSDNTDYIYADWTEAQEYCNNIGAGLKLWTVYESEKIKTIIDGIAILGLYFYVDVNNRLGVKMIYPYQQDEYYELTTLNQINKNIIKDNVDVAEKQHFTAIKVTYIDIEDYAEKTYQYPEDTPPTSDNITDYGLIWREIKLDYAIEKMHVVAMAQKQVDFFGKPKQIYSTTALLYPLGFMNCGDTIEVNTEQQEAKYYFLTSLGVDYESLITSCSGYDYTDVVLSNWFILGDTIADPDPDSVLGTDMHLARLADTEVDPNSDNYFDDYDRINDYNDHRDGCNRLWA